MSYRIKNKVNGQYVTRYDGTVKEFPNFGSAQDYLLMTFDIGANPLKHWAITGKPKEKKA